MAKSIELNRIFVSKSYPGDGYALKNPTAAGFRKLQSGTYIHLGIIERRNWGFRLHPSGVALNLTWWVWVRCIEWREGFRLRPDWTASGLRSTWRVGYECVASSAVRSPGTLCAGTTNEVEMSAQYLRDFKMNVHFLIRTLLEFIYKCLFEPKKW